MTVRLPSSQSCRIDPADVPLKSGVHGSEIADILLAKNIPFGFVTGYGHALEQRHAGIPLLQKPFNSEQLRVLLETIVGPGGSPNHSTSHAA